MWLADTDYPEDRFTVGDLIMTTVLRELFNSGVSSRFASLDAYRTRREARPAFGRAMEAGGRARSELATSTGHERGTIAGFSRVEAP